MGFSGALRRKTGVRVRFLKNVLEKGRRLGYPGFLGSQFKRAMGVTRTHQIFPTHAPALPDGNPYAANEKKVSGTILKGEKVSGTISRGKGARFI